MNNLSPALLTLPSSLCHAISSLDTASPAGMYDRICPQPGQLLVNVADMQVYSSTHPALLVHTAFPGVIVCVN